MKAQRVDHELHLISFHGVLAPNGKLRLYSARINGLDLYAYLKDVLERLPTHPASRIDELLPHPWSATS